MSATSPMPGEIGSQWQEIGAAVEKMRRRLDSASAFPVSAGSSLAGDDKHSDPYCVSHAVQLCLVGGTDHLHAAKSLILDAQMLHTFALYALLRASLETLSAGFWILHPAKRNVRIERALRWHAKNFKEAEIALGPRNVPGHQPLEDRLKKLEKVAVPRAIAPTAVREGYRSSTAVKYAEEHAVASPLLSWQLCSGYAHGRLWAILGMSETALYPHPDPQVQNVRLSSNAGRVLFPAHTAYLLMEQLAQLLGQRS